MADSIGGLHLVRAGESLRLSHSELGTDDVQFEVDALGELSITPVSGEPIFLGAGLEVDGDIMCTGNILVDGGAEVIGNVGIGTAFIVGARLLLAAGAASYVPIQLTSGTVKTTAVAGGMEFLNDDFFLTITTAAARKGIVLDNGARLTSGTIPVATTNGRLIDAIVGDFPTLNQNTSGSAASLSAALAYNRLPTGGGTWANGGALSITGGVTTVAGLIGNGPLDVYAVTANGNASSTRSFGLEVRAGTTSADKALLMRSVAGTDWSHYVRGDGLFVVSRVMSSASFSTHTFEDFTTLAATGAGNSYATFDSLISIVNGNAQNYDHISHFQARGKHLGSGVLSYWYGFMGEPTITGPATNVLQFQVRDALGAGAITKQVGLRVESLTRGSTNYAVETLGTTPSIFGGTVTVSGDGIVSGGLRVTGSVAAATADTTVVDFIGGFSRLVALGGAARGNISFVVAKSGAADPLTPIVILNTGQITFDNDLLFTDTLYDIGKSGATRPRDGFFSRNLVLGGTLAVTGVSTLTGNVGIGIAPIVKFHVHDGANINAWLRASGGEMQLMSADDAFADAPLRINGAPLKLYGTGALALTITGAAVAFAGSLASTTALATPSALSATQFTAFASTVSGAAIMGYGTTNDVALMNRAGTVVLGVGPNTTLVNMAGGCTIVGAYTSGTPNGGTAKPWKFGNIITGQVGLLLIATQYVELDVNGTLYRLATV